MQVYIEDLIIDNFTITYLISKITYALLKLKDSKIRYVICAVIGMVAAFIYPLLKANSVILLLIKLAIWMILSIVLFVKKNKFFVSALVFLLTTFLFGGAMIAIGYLIYGNLESALKLPPFNFPYGIAIIGVYLLYRVIHSLIKYIKRRYALTVGKRKFSIEVMGKTIDGEGLLDSGNLLTDNGKPVIILGLKLATKLLTDEQFGQLALGKGENINYEAHYIESTTLTKKHKILIVSSGQIRLYSEDNSNINITVSVGISLNLHSFDAILSPQILYAEEVG